MVEEIVNCHHCGRALSEGEDSGYCNDCSKLVENEGLQDWARQWAQSIVTPGLEEHFYTILSAVWEQAFAKARTFQGGTPIYSLQDNPFQGVASAQEPEAWEPEPQAEAPAPRQEESYAPPQESAYEPVNRGGETHGNPLLEDDWEEDSEQFSRASYHG